MTYSPNSYAVRKDSNHKEIVKAIRKLGCSVLDLAAVGRGCPDLLVAIPGKTTSHTVLIEVKSPKGRLRPDQIKFRDNWKGLIGVVRSVDDITYIINCYKSK